ncbi:polyadenylate-binding protein-interacting protein 4 isoform X1 [Panicum miliaceum]|uniref:Polyadenylate-binding protein-interacting protein 4 isoform X1 n=1 Tax=Panicum miliaceum TaxID=4540 RepID=A0A3L6QFJ0_PANMI|nr:polyadenylate-binding protein-interacting protein 4 isoform X1 [Panicum miliaceum]
MMSHQQQMAPPSRGSVNGLPHRKLDRESSGRRDNKTNLVRSSSGGLSGAENGIKLGHASHSRDRLIYVLTQLIGHHVDVHVKNGSIISGIFHATNSDKDFGVVLKMALVIKDGSARGQIYGADVVKKPETMIIPARELVQVFAKDVALGGDELPKGPGHDKRKDLLIDSAISRTHYLEERELERWAPDEGDSECIELEKYDRKGNRSWDQFETNAALFGVKSTFNEEIYTTKLERGPHMRELEKHASRIAREIEGEDTKDIHLAEERGLFLGDDLDHDEEIKYSAVRRDTDNSKYKSFTNVPNSTRHVDSFNRTANIDPKDSLACSSTMDEESSSYIFDDTDSYAIIQTNNVSQPTSDDPSNKPFSIDESRLDKKLSNDGNDNLDKRKLQPENTQLSGGGRPLISEGLDGPPSSSHAYEPSSSGQGFKSPETLDSTVSVKHPSAVEPVTSSQRPGSSTSSTSERIAANSVASAPGLSPSSSIGSLTSEKSSLNPNAKEFKLNPNAKSFTPSVSLRPPPSPASDASYYYPNNMLAAPLGPGLPVGMGFPPAYGGQPVMFNTQPGTPPQGYMHPAGPQYGQQMMMGQTRPVYYYAPEMQQYRGRNF